MVFLRNLKSEEKSSSFEHLFMYSKHENICNTYICVILNNKIKTDFSTVILMDECKAPFKKRDNWSRDFFSMEIFNTVETITKGM